MGFRLHSLRTSRRAAARAAFTLLELLIVLSLLVVLSFFAWPMMESQITAAKLPESAARIRETLYMTRSAAMLEHRRHRVRFAPGEQQPTVEIEIDPLYQPGVWTLVSYPWTKEPMLLDDAEVHEIQPGRPVYLKPVSETEDADSKAAKEETQRDASLEFQVTQGEQIGSVSIASGNDEAELDEKRPPIVFETDGSSDWATIIISEVRSDEALEEETPQLWVVLDGRTGLANVREQVTQEQLADPEFYIQKEKLELPETTSPDDLSLTISTDEQGQLIDPAAAAGLGGEQLGLNGQGIPGPGQSGLVDPNAMPQDQLAGQLPPEGDSALPAEQPSEQQLLDDLEKELAESDLSEEEKEEIRKNFQSNSSAK
jgi:prepilin-type N-terminal cleavage/methylation domain-containing protein